MYFFLGFCVAVGTLALLVFVSAKIIMLGGLKYLYLKAGALGAIYGLIVAFFCGWLRSVGLEIAQFEYLMFAPEIFKTHAAQLNAESMRLSIELALLQNGFDFAIKGSILVIGIIYALRHSGIPCFRFLQKL